MGRYQNASLRANLARSEALKVLVSYGGVMNLLLICVFLNKLPDNIIRVARHKVDNRYLNHGVGARFLF